ncbi:MAG: hypothetical protein AMXMBFR59_15310 [Rhodanobacteraceae bacterium]
MPLGIVGVAAGVRQRNAGLYWPPISALGFAMFPFPRTGLSLALSVLSFAAVAAGPAAPADADLGRKQTVSQENSQIEHYCAEMEEVTFVGNGNRIVTMGGCHSITIQGSGNTVDVQSLATQITVNGDDNKVTWPPADRPAPVTKVSGRRNTVEREKIQ